MGQRVLLIAIAVGTQLAGMTFAHAADDARAASAARDADLVQALRRGGYVIFFRHALSDQQQADTDRADLARCETQRNLSGEGRRMAREIGEAFKALEIRVGKVLASPFCRTVDTAELAFGKHEKAEGLKYTMGADQAQHSRQTEELRRMLGTVPPRGINTVLVSHNVNLKEATGVWPKRDGDAHVFRPRPDGGFDHVGEVTPADWSCWSGKSSNCRRAAPGSSREARR